MKINAFQRRPLGVVALATALTVVLLTACSSKPPGCSDEQTVNVAKSLVLAPWKSDMSQASKSDPDLAQYNEGLKVEIRNITVDSYNAEARKYTCNGAFVVTTLRGMEFTMQRDFTSQATANGKEKFVVQIGDMDFLFRPLYNDMLIYTSQRSEEKKKEQQQADALRRKEQDRPLSISPIEDKATDASQSPAVPIPQPQPSPSPTPQPQPSPVSPKVESQGPSFDCSKASTAVERAICGDPKLAELDLAMVNAYNVTLSKLPNKQDARTEQGMWMRQVRNACTSVQCLADAYQRRLAQLK